MEPKRLSNAIIDPNENDMDSSLLLSQLLLSQVGPRDEEKVEEKLKKIPKDQYLCPKCLIPHEIRHINEETKEIEIHCANKCQTKYSIKEYLTHMCRISYFYYKCECCKKKIQKNFKIDEGNIFKYCFECNKIICLQCFDFMHQKLNHKNVVPSNEIFNKCTNHPNEDFIQFCINCSTHLCPKCTFTPHKGHILVTLNSIIPTQKEIDKFKNKKEEYNNKKKELLKQIEDIDNLIYLNDIVLQTYLKHQKNYYYIINVLNLYNNNINNNEIISNNDIDDEEDLDDIINRSNRCNTLDKRVRKNYLKRKVNNLKNDYDADTKESIGSAKNIGTYKKTKKKFSKFHDDNIDKKDLKELLTNIVKNKERKEKSVDRFELSDDKVNKKKENKKIVNRRNIDEPGLRFDSEKNRERHCSQEVRTGLELEQGNEYLTNFTKEYGNKPFLDKRKIELWGMRMGKEGLLTIINNKHKFIEIEELTLGRVKLNSIDFLENIKLDRLRLLNLELNRISNLNILANLYLKNVETLNLSNNSISSIGILSKTSMSNLQNLNLSRNFIDSIDILSRVNFPKLKVLLLSENKISNISVLSKVSFLNLNELFLNSNSINSIDVFKEVKFPFLKILNLSGNKISSIDALGTIPCSKLEEINLKNNLIINIEPISKVNLSSLKGLHLDNNKIIDISCLAKTHLKSLQRLYLSNNLISNINTFKFLPFPKLDTLTLVGNKINNKDKNNKKILDDLEKKKIYIGF